jgi:ATP-dependent RNA helicase RhlE
MGVCPLQLLALYLTTSCQSKGCVLYFFYYQITLVFGLRALPAAQTHSRDALFLTRAGLSETPYIDSAGRKKMTTTNAPTEHSFDTLGIDRGILDSLIKLGITTPTPIQHQAIPQAIEGKDVIGIAQTGTGKTLAFGIPMLQRLMNSEQKGLILLPTRELALQVDESLARLGGPLGLKAAVLIGGANMRQQVGALRRNPDIVIATPGRLIDHVQQGTIRLDKVAILVLDEADRMLDMGFQPQIKKILETVPKDRQTLLFSATLSGDIAQIATKHMKTPISIEVAPQGTTAEKVTQEFFIVHREQKIALLESVLQKYQGSTLVFARTKHGAKKIMMAVKDMGHKAAEIHGNRSLSQRRDALDGFKTGKYRVLVATDIASRGIDVKGIELVVNFDLPMDSADYVHRIGRTARAGADGHAISFAMPQERGGMRDIERLIRKPLNVSQLPVDLPGPRPMAYIQDAPRSGGQHRPYRGGGGGGYRGGGRPQFGRGGGRSQGGGSRSSGSRPSFSQGPVSAETFPIRTGGRPQRRAFHRTPRHKRSSR